MSGHNHQGQIATYGECITCATAPGPPATVTENRAKVGRSSPATSRKAAVATLPRSGSHRHRILACLAANPAGLTDEQIASRTGLTTNTVRPRRGELYDAEWVEDTGERRPSPLGNPSAVWAITDEGREALAAT